MRTKGTQVKVLKQMHDGLRELRDSYDRTSASDPRYAGSMAVGWRARIQKHMIVLQSLQARPHAGGAMRGASTGYRAVYKTLGEIHAASQRGQLDKVTMLGKKLVGFSSATLRALEKLIATS